MKIALAMIVKGSDDEAELLANCLHSFRYGPDGKPLDAIDGIFITRTHLPGEILNKRVKEVADEYGAIVSDFEWCYDFAAARNFNFAQVPKEYDYIIWSDADDQWRGLEKLKPTLAEHPHMDAFGMLYLYDWDEFKKPTVVHRKTMLVKNDGCVEWSGRLHEDLTETRRLDVQLIDGIERLHITSKERADANALRNLDIAEREIKDKPEDPRSYWNLANSQFGLAKYAEAQDNFEKFLKESGSEDEKYLARMRLADVYKAQGNREQAVTQLQTAIGMQPYLPDAYFQLAHAHYSFGDPETAEMYCIQGLRCRPEPKRMIVYNPRDYDYNPLMLLASIYFDINRPDMMLTALEQALKIYPDDVKLQNLVAQGKLQKEELRKGLETVDKLKDITDKDELKAAIDALPDDLRSHPAVSVLRNTNFIKDTSSGKDLVIYCGHTEHEWNPEMFKTKGVGGSEEAVIHLARQWAKLGWNVTVYNNCGYKGMKDGKNVVYKPFWEFNYRDKQDVVILWRWIKPLDAEINAPRIYVDLHDVVPAGEFNEKRLKRVTKVFVKTHFHRSLFPNIPDDKIEVIPNGMESYLDPKIKKDPMLVINTSSPDRSMDVLPKLWKRVKQHVPEARLQWAYGWDIYKQAHAADPKKIAWMEEIQAQMDEAGIETLGRLAQSEVGKLYQRASFLAYPTEFAEIDCISVKKAQAARCLPVATDFGALNESITYGLKVHSQKTGFTWNKPYQFHFGLEDEEAQNKWVAGMVMLLNSAKVRGEEQWRGLDEWRAQFAWPAIAKRWDNIFGI